MLSEIVVGPRPAADGSPLPLRGGRQGEGIVQQAHGRYYEAAYRKNVMYACNSAAQAVSVALTTTYTGIMLSNPAGSPVNLSLMTVGWGVSIAEVALSVIGLIGGMTAAGVVTHTTPLIPASTFLGGLKGFGLVDSAATIPTPVWLQTFESCVVATGYFSGQHFVDVNGLWILPPGGFIGIGALTAVTGIFSLTWEEVPV